jgi:hypothetical protein
VPSSITIYGFYWSVNSSRVIFWTLSVKYSLSQFSKDVYDKSSLYGKTNVKSKKNKDGYVVTPYWLESIKLVVASILPNLTSV